VASVVGTFRLCAAIQYLRKASRLAAMSPLPSPVRTDSRDVTIVVTSDDTPKVDENTDHWDDELQDMLDDYD
jgi:hypothetical protein